ncbi:ATP synthase epsilon chain [Endomicrobiia bacterium]|nr:ATP synthase epsilon chain [Endomicrobiia bacterium]GHT65280.1 ATP synthase epsilon chain [Endomicrobiia bacterium]GHT70436.1 ATP synthase epsilon chain [Endomicrobiia bacterium]GHT75052.1 ATP synthase epsilon chain [Endomicrobiia bacterium]
MNKFVIEILSPQGIIFKGELSSVSFPTTSGMITVLPGHVNLVTKLRRGEIVITSSNAVKKIVVSGGFVEIANNNINVVAEFAAHSDATNKQKVDQAMQLAKYMKAKRKEFVDISATELRLKKSAADLKSGLVIKRRKI